MNPKITKAIFPVAGLGTRFLPATKSIPKEMLPLVDKPLLQYAVNEAREAGIEQFIFITAREKSALADYFDRHHFLEEMLDKNGKTDILARVQESNISNEYVAYLRQGQPLGLGHAVSCARHFIHKDEYFAVLLPDDVIKAEIGCLKQMVQMWQDTPTNIVGAMQVSRDVVSSYGILDMVGRDENIAHLRGLVEKPKAADAPSDCAVIGRYILSPRVMDHLSDTPAGAGGEIQLTDALNQEIKTGAEVKGYFFKGERYDCGTPDGFLQATIEFGLANPQTRAGLEAFLRKRFGKD